VNDASLSIAPARGRPWGVIIVVLVIDLALAATGGWMLSEGLAEPPVPAQPGSADNARTGSTSNKVEAIGKIARPVAAPVAAPVADPVPANPSTLIRTPDPVATPEPSRSKPRARKQPKPVKGRPVDPYSEPPPPGPPLPPYPPPPSLPQGSQ